MKPTVRNCCGMALLLLSLCALALDLGEAKRQGLVGEQLDGYLGVVQAGASAEVQGMVLQINQERRKSYQAIADKNRLDLGTVQKLAAEKAIQRTESGHFIQSADGRWVRK